MTLRVPLFITTSYMDRRCSTSLSQRLPTWQRMNTGVSPSLYSKTVNLHPRSGTDIQNHTWLGDMADQVVRVELVAGNTMIIPTGWIHAVVSRGPRL